MDTLTTKKVVKKTTRKRTIKPKQTVTIVEDKKDVLNYETKAAEEKAIRLQLAKKLIDSEAMMDKLINLQRSEGIADRGRFVQLKVFLKRNIDHTRLRKILNDSSNTK